MLQVSKADHFCTAGKQGWPLFAAGKQGCPLCATGKQGQRLFPRSSPMLSGPVSSTEHYEEGDAGLQRTLVVAFVVGYGSCLFLLRVATVHQLRLRLRAVASVQD